MRLFVSYSRRDGIVTTDTLRKLENQIKKECSPFIHCLQDSGSRWEQVRVIRALMQSDAILLIDSPAASTSGWVKLELIIGKILNLPIKKIKAKDIEKFKIPPRSKELLGDATL